MSDGTKKEQAPAEHAMAERAREGREEQSRSWQDSAGTEWRVRRREERGVRPGWVISRVDYAFVAFEESPEAPTEERLQRWIDGHRSSEPGAGGTARLWTDPRDGTEWEVHREGGDLVFRVGTEAIRASDVEGERSPRDMSDEELRMAFDRAQGGD